MPGRWNAAKERMGAAFERLRPTIGRLRDLHFLLVTLPLAVIGAVTFVLLVLPASATTALGLYLAGVAAGVTVLVVGLVIDRRLVRRPTTTPATVPPSTFPRWRKHEGVLWRDDGRNWYGAARGPIAEGPFCPHHRVRLLYRGLNNRWTETVHDEQYISAHHGSLVCPEGNHELGFPGAHKIGEVREQVAALFERDRAADREAKPG